MKMTVGMLLKNVYVDDSSKKNKGIYYEYIDLVAAICYKNREGKRRVNLLTGSCQGQMISAISCITKDDAFAFYELGLETFIETDDAVDFFSIRSRYFVPSVFWKLNADGEITLVENKVLIKKLKQESLIKQKIDEEKVDRYIRDVQKDMLEIGALKYEEYEKDLQTLYDLAQSFIEEAGNTSEAIFLYANRSFIQKMVDIENKIQVYKNNKKENQLVLDQTLALLKRQNIDLFLDSKKED